MNELAHALALAERVLNRPNADPDDDVAVLARQFLRAMQPAEGGPWRPICEAKGAPGVYIDVRSIRTFRWLAYKPEGARQMRKPGRWQAATEYGWTNAELPTLADFRLNLPLAAGAAR